MKQIRNKSMPRSWLMGQLAKSGAGPSLLSKVFGVSKMRVAQVAEVVGRGESPNWPSGRFLSVTNYRKLLCFMTSFRDLALHETRTASGLHLLPRILLLAAISSNLEHLTSEEFVRRGPVQCELSYLPGLATLRNGKGTTLQVNFQASETTSLGGQGGPKGGTNEIQ